MENDKKTSVIKEALVEFNEIQEAAIANAKKNLTEKYPEKFNDLLKEELNKNKKTKESYKKIDESKESEVKDNVKTNKEENVMKKQTNETKKVNKKGEAKNQPFDKKAPENGPDVVKEEREKDFVGDVENDTPNLADGKTEDGDTYDEKITTKKETLANKTSIKEEFDVTDLDADSVGTALENADDEDEVITMDEIETEIQGMDSIEEKLNDMSGLPRPELQKRGSAEGQEGDAFTKLVEMRKQLDEMISGMGVDEQKNNGGQGANKVNTGGPTQSMVDEEDSITDADVEAVLGAPEDEEAVEEHLQHTQTHGNARTVGSQNNTNYGKENRLRDNMNENKKISSLINENKGLTKKLNGTKKYKQSVSTLVEQYKSALEKYRNQLKEMATFNTNLAHVNNLLVNESLALTQEDKVKIINEFKKVDTIAESQKKYKSFLSEMKESKPTLSESIEEKVNTSVAPSSKQNLEEAKEITAYADDDHIKKMKRLIEYADKRGSKKII
ncbi:MAG: hypothetical protein PF487_09875 [Bacteroidales bacterium]|jgi:hypothetical protein|nr:hypothetical protein [Bacteroidales bacterium]